MKIIRAPHALTKGRVRAAYAVAVAADIVQLALGPFPLADQVVDVAAAGAIMALIGFHPLLLPTFVLELVPVADLLPTWTGCVALVMMLRRRDTPPSPAGPGDIIDV